MTLTESLEAVLPDDKDTIAGFFDNRAYIDAQDLNPKVWALLANIIGFSELLIRKQRRDIPAENLQYLRYIRETGLRLERLLEEVLGGYPRNLDQPVISVDALADACSKLVEKEVESTQVKLAVDVAPEAVAAQVPKYLLEETVSGLLLVAIKNTAAGGKVGLRCSLSGEMVLFSVWRTFSPGWQAGVRLDEDISRTEKILMQARELSKAHGGRFWVEGTMGETSSYCLLLPLVKKNVTIQARVSGPNSEVSSQNPE
ncbi:MAG: hypothetical protein AB1510_12205 [Bacillota bacterium]